MHKTDLKLQQRKAIYLLVACQMDEAVVAKHVGVSVRTIKRWLKHPKFRALVEEVYERLEDQDAKKHRQFANKLIAKTMYDEIFKRLVAGKDVENMSLGALLRTVRDVNFENRLDDGQATDRTEHKHVLDDLMGRFAQLQEAGPAKEEVEGRPELKLIEAPIKKEKANA